MIQGRFRGMIVILACLFSAVASATEFPAVPGEFVVKLKATATVMNTVQIENILGGTIKEQINKSEGLVLLQRPAVELATASLASLNNMAMVEYAEPNYIYRLVGGVSSLPNDPELHRLWGLINTGQNVEGDAGRMAGIAGVDIGAAQAWPVEVGTSEILVAVIDTGVNWANPDLQANMFVNEAEKNGQPGVDDDNNGCIDDIYGCDFVGNDGDPMDVYGHGTHVSGTIGAVTNNGDGIAGVAWNVRILPVRFLGNNGSGTLADAIKSIDYATAMKVHIMNNSWGGGGFSQALMDSIIRAKDAGILFLAAAGNSSGDNDTRPEYPAAYQVDNVMAVAAIDPRGMLAGFSNYGKNTVQIAAPGVNILSYTMNGLESWSGTSMACPHVAGVAALLLSQDLTQPYLTIKERLMTSARPLSALRNRVTTAGMVNAYYALTNQIAPVDPNDPYNWQRDGQTSSTEHPYANSISQTWTFTVPGAKKVAVYFTRFETEGGYDKVTFTDAAGQSYGVMSGNLGEAYGPAVVGDTVTLTFTSDGTVQMYGFDISGIAYEME